MNIEEQFTPKQLKALDWLSMQWQKGKLPEEFSVIWVGGEAHILDIECDSDGLSNLSLGALNGLVDAGLLKRIQPIDQGWQYGFTSKAITVFRSKHMSSCMTMHTYRGYKISVEKSKGKTGTFESWIVVAHDNSGLEVEVLLKVSDLFIAGSPLVIAQEGGLDNLAENRGVEYIHGLIDTADYQKGEQIEYVIGSWSVNDQNNLLGSPDSKKIQDILLYALKRKGSQYWQLPHSKDRYQRIECRTKNFG